MSKRDYYEILGVSRSASDQEIKSAYRKLALQVPSRSQRRRQGRGRALQGSGRGVRRAVRRRQAGALRPLRPCRRRRRVRPGGAGFDPSVFTEFQDIFGGLGDIFGFGGGRRGGPQRGSDLRYDLEIEFAQAAKGVETSIQIPRHETCTTCKGSGAAAGSSPTTCPQCRGAGQLRYQQGFFTVARTCGQCRGAGKVIAKPCPACKGDGTIEQTRKLTVKIPAGIATGQRLRLTGEGEAGTHGGPTGDLYVVIIVREHEFFQRDGNDLHCQVSLPFTTLALGGDIKVPAHRGPETIKIAESTQTGTVFRLRGKGMPDVSGRGRGDLLVTVQAVTPKKLNKEQKRLLEELAATLPDQKVKPRSRDEDDDRGIFGKVKDIFG